MTPSNDFDFAAWTSSNPLRPPSFGHCAAAAMKQLALGEADLPSRLRGAMFCLLYSDRASVPVDLRPAYDEIAQYVTELIGDQDLSAIYMRKWNINIKTARRFARQIVWPYEQAIARGVQ